MSHSPTPRQRIVIISFISFLLAAPLATFAQEKEKDTKKEKSKKASAVLLHKTLVKKMMLAVHRGANTPASIIDLELKKPKPDWDKLNKNVAFVELMGLALQQPNRKQNVYAKSSGQLIEGIKKRDIKTATKGHEAFKSSCLSCHGWAGSYDNLTMEIKLKPGK